MQDYNLPEYEEQITDPKAAAKLYKKKTAKFKVVWEARHELIVEAETEEEAREIWWNKLLFNGETAKTYLSELLNVEKV